MFELLFAHSLHDLKRIFRKGDKLRTIKTEASHVRTRPSGSSHNFLLQSKNSLNYRQFYIRVPTVHVLKGEKETAGFYCTHIIVRTFLLSFCSWTYSWVIGSDWRSGREWLMRIAFCCDKSLSASSSFMWRLTLINHRQVEEHWKLTAANSNRAISATPVPTSSWYGNVSVHSSAGKFTKH